MNSKGEIRYAASDLVELAKTLCEKVGLIEDRAQMMAEILVEADLMGHPTHGLKLLDTYLSDLESGGMAAEGDPVVIRDTGSTVAWDGQYLPGPYLVLRAMNLAFERIEEHPVVSVAIHHSHHIACLAAYLRRATERGLFVMIMSSDPSVASVAPFGGIRPLYTPDPLAAGIPTESDPILIDISMSNTANGWVSHYQAAGEPMPGEWLMDNEGNATADPNKFFDDPPGSILPLGGMDLGYKGFALGLLIEALTSALAGEGRSNPSGQWGASVFVQVINPDAFGGLDNFKREMQWLVDASRANPVKEGNPPVRLPGERGLQLRREQLEKGVALYPSIMPSLEKWIEKFGLDPLETVK